MLKRIECIHVVCDGCGEDCENGDGYATHYPAELEGEAEEEAMNADWHVWNGHHWCDRDGCLPACSACGHLFSDHEYGDADCTFQFEPVGDCPCVAFTVEDK